MNEIYKFHASHLLLKIPNVFKILSKEQIQQQLSIPPQKNMGDLFFPCFQLAKMLKKSPNEVAKNISDQINENDHFSKIEIQGPYVNFFLNKINFINNIIKSIIIHSDNNFFKKDFSLIGIQKNGIKKTILIDFSSPNIAKPFSISHLRSTSIGNSLSKIFSYLGCKVIKINHIGDWGTSFGKLIVAYKKWGNEYDFENSPVKKLLELYVRFHKELEKNINLENEARNYFKKLEKGDPESINLWKWFKKISLNEFKLMYKKLGVDFDYYLGESFYQKEIEIFLDNLNCKKMLKKSEGATIFELEINSYKNNNLDKKNLNFKKYSIPPVLLKKRDGSTLYATRDMAAAIYRHRIFKFDQMLYVVGIEQSLHFKQIFKALELMGYDWVVKCKHVSFGLIQFRDKKMSSRKGNIIFLENVIEKASNLILKKMNESKNENEITSQEKYELKNKADKLAINSIFFSDLKNGRVKNVVFDWDEILNSKGETGIYLQYAYVRLCSLIKKFKTQFGTKAYEEVKLAKIKITEITAFNIAKELSNFTNKVIFAAENFEPSIIAKYLLDLAQSFSFYYREYKIINVKQINLSQQRLFVVLAVQKILADGLYLLGIKTLEKM